MLGCVAGVWVRWRCGLAGFGVVAEDAGTGFGQGGWAAVSGRRFRGWWRSPGLKQPSFHNAD